MIDFSKIHRFSLSYMVYKHIVHLALKIFYREIHVLNQERVPKNAAVILAPNHQNALMDALVILTCLRGKTFFLARADLFAKKRIAKILRFMCIMPVFRIRDGFSNLNQNDKTFRFSIELLKRKKRLGIMPEGNHDGFRRLRSLKKGIPRIAFQYAEETHYKEAIYIVPVGLDFTHYWHLGAKVVVNFGEPIDVRQHRTLYETNPAQAYVALNHQLSDALKARMIHIESTDFYAVIDQLREISGSSPAHFHQLDPNYRPANVEAQKHLVEKLDKIAKENPAELKLIGEKLKAYFSLLKQYKLRDHTIENFPYRSINMIVSSLLFLVGSPIFVLGLTVGFASFKLPVLASKKIKDVQFWSSFNFVIGLLVSLLVILVISIVSFYVTKSFANAGLLTLLLVCASVFASRYSFRFKKYWSAIKFTYLFKHKHHEALRLLELRNEIINYAVRIQNG